MNRDSSFSPPSKAAFERDLRVRRKLLVDGRCIVVDGPAEVTVASLLRALPDQAAPGSALTGMALAGVALADVANGPLEPGASEFVLGGWSLVVSAGPDVLRSHVLGPDASVVVGRRLPGPDQDAPGCWTIGDDTLSQHHAEFLVVRGSLTVRDLGSRNGTEISPDSDGEARVVRLGATTIVCRPTEHDALRPVGAYDFDRSTGTWRTHRSIVRRSAPPPLDVPLARHTTRIRVRVRPGAILGPLLGGAAMALLVDPRFAVLALLSPVLLVVNALDDRRALARERRTGERDFASAFDAFVGRVAAAQQEWTVQAATDFPDAASLLSAAQGSGGRVWWRGRGDELGWHVRVGAGPIRFRPALHAAGPIPDAVAEFLDGLVIPEGPFTVDLGPREVVAVVGPRSDEIVRTLIAGLFIGFGPTSVAIVVDDDPGNSAPSWRRWLPHPDTADGAPHSLFVQFSGRGVGGASSRRHFLDSYRDGAVVVAVDRPEQVPADATSVVTITHGPLGAFHRPGGVGSCGVVADGMCAEGLDRLAMLVSRWSEGSRSASSSLPDSLPFDDMLSWLEPSGGRTGREVEPTVAERWRAVSRSHQMLLAPLGTDGHQLVSVDLVADGPHALVAGTTGSGKSELLRTLITGLASQYPPDLVTFVLIDYKGGSAFAECESLPHTVGFMTDLDQGLASRALTCLEAELRRRESVLRDSGERDLVSYSSTLGREPMPRLLVVIDELAALVRDLPNFVPSLVSLAQRGRTLGLHLLLATQRPAGTISDAIRANTNIRIALRVQDPSDSVDVIGQPDAAFVDRRCPGRAFVRLGPGEVTTVQVAAVGLASRRTVTTVTNFDGAEILRFPRPAASPDDAMSPLVRRVRDIADAHRLSGHPKPRQPWPSPLPRELDRRQSDVASIGLADEPATQWQGEFVLDLAAGSVAVVGSLGTGVTTTLRTIVCALASSSAHVATQIYVLDLVGRELESLAAFPRVGAVIGGHEEERRERLMTRLRAEVVTRRDSLRDDAAGSLIVVVIDGWSMLRTSGGDATLLALGDALARLIVEGAAVGLRFVIGTDRATSLTSAIAPSIATRLVLCPADAAEAAASGVRFSPSAVGVPGRAVIANRPGFEVQVWRTTERDAASAAGDASEEHPAPGVDVLADEVSLEEVLTPAAAGWPVSRDRSAWEVPVGIGGDALGVVRVFLRAGEPFLVCGPPRSGRLTVLDTISAVLAALQPDVEVLFWQRAQEMTVFIASVRDACRGGRRTLVVLDDVERIDDPHGQLAQLLADDDDALRVVLAGRADLLRVAYGHWSAAARRSRHGLALRPNPDVDGDLWHTPLPRRLQVRGGPGRGVVVSDGAFAIVQVAHRAGWEAQETFQGQGSGDRAPG